MAIDTILQGLETGLTARPNRVQTWASFKTYSGRVTTGTHGSHKDRAY